MKQYTISGVCFLFLLSISFTSALSCVITEEQAVCDNIESVFVFLPVILFIAMSALFFCIFLFIFWILMLVDCVNRDFRKDEDKVLWILILILTHIIGSIVYYFAVKRKGEPKKKKKS